MEQLRATLKSDLQEKNDILDKLTFERGTFLLHKIKRVLKQFFLLTLSISFVYLNFVTKTVQDHDEKRPLVLLVLCQKWESNWEYMCQWFKGNSLLFEIARSSD